MENRVKKIIFWAVFIVLVLAGAELIVSGARFFRKNLKNRSLPYTPVEARLLELREERKKGAKEFSDSVVFSEEVYVLGKGKKYLVPRPNSTIAVVRSERIGYMHMLYDEEVIELLSGFDGETYLKNFDDLSMRVTGAGGGDTSILMLGDSFTEGSYVDDNETFSSVVEEKLRADGVIADVLNAGVSGHATKEEYFRLADLLEEPIDLDMVVVNYFPNDGRVIEHKVVGYWEPKKPHAGPALWWYENVGIARVFIRSYYSFFSKPADPRDDEKVQTGWKTSFYWMSKIVALCRENGLTLIVSAIPPKEQFAYGKEDFYQDILKEYCEDNGIIFIDPYDHLKRSGARGLYLTWDPHFTKEGHAIYADFLYIIIKDLLRTIDTAKIS